MNHAIGHTGDAHISRVSFEGSCIKNATMKVSVVVPVRNEEKSLPVLLESLLEQDHPPDEIVVADGGSEDETVVVARRYADGGVRVLEIGPAYPGRGRNEAIKSAENEWIALIDAGCIPDKMWLSKLLEPLRDERVRVVFGQFAPRIESEWDVAQALSFVGPIDPDSKCRHWSIASSLVHRSAWEKVGGFPEDLRASEDLVFFERIRAARIPTARSAEAVVRWSLASSPGAVFRRFRLYSAHHMASGLWRTWHVRVFLMNLVGAVLAAASLIWHPAVALLLGAFFGRVLRSIYMRRGNIMDGSAFRLDRVARVAMLLLLADLAAWMGACDLLLKRAVPDDS